MRITLSLIIFILTLFSCQTIDFPTPDADNTAPQFFASGLINGQTWGIKAGENNYYMDSYFEKNNLNVYAFNAHLRPANCTSDCPNSIIVKIRDVQSNTNLPDINKSLAIGPREITSEIKDSIKYLVRSAVECRGGDSVSTVFWRLNEKRFAELPDLTFSADQKNNLDMVVMHNLTGIITTLSQQLSLHHAANIQVRILKSANGYKITVISNDEQKNPIRSIIWSNGKMDQELELTQFPSSLKAQIELANKSQIQLKIEAPGKTEFNGALCAINYAVEPMSIPVQNALKLNTVEISYFDAQSVHFSSNYNRQNGRLVIEKVEDFPGLANGFKTKKVTMIFSATLKDKTKTRSVTMENIQFTCAIAYPN